MSAKDQLKSEILSKSSALPCAPPWQWRQWRPQLCLPGPEHTRKGARQGMVRAQRWHAHAQHVFARARPPGLLEVQYVRALGAAAAAGRRLAAAKKLNLCCPALASFVAVLPINVKVGGVVPRPRGRQALLFLQREGGGGK
jgi:hypothetical protein